MYARADVSEKLAQSTFDETEELETMLARLRAELKQLQIEDVSWFHTSPIDNPAYGVAAAQEAQRRLHPLGGRQGQIFALCRTASFEAGKDATSYREDKGWKC